MGDNDNNQELVFNKQNREDYERLMEESSTKTDGYWDKSDSFVRILLLALLGISIIGSMIVFISYFSHK